MVTPPFVPSFAPDPTNMIMFPLVHHPIHWKPNDVVVEGLDSLYESLREDEQKFVDSIMDTLYMFDYYPLMPVYPLKPSENVLKTIKMLKEKQNG